MQSQYKNNKHPQIKPRSTFLNIRNMLLSTTLLFLFFVVIFSSNIKAQIASLISEDGDGIVGITSLMNATINGDVQSVKFFAKSGAFEVNQKNIGGATALHIAARNGNAEIAKILIENGADVNLFDKEGWTPLMRSALSRNPELIKILLNANADAAKVNSLGETAIIHATSSECLECLEQLFSRYDFVKNMNIETLKTQLKLAMDDAANKNRVDIQSVLTEYYSETILMDNKANTTPIDAVNINNNQDTQQTEIALPISSKSQSQNKKIIYKFLGEKNQVNQADQEDMTRNFQPNDQIVEKDIIFNKTDEVVIGEALINNNPKTTKINKSFIFKGDRKKYIPYSLEVIQEESIKTNSDNLKESNIFDSNNKEPYINKVTEVNEDFTSNNPIPPKDKENLISDRLKYKFLGQTKSDQTITQNTTPTPAKTPDLKPEVTSNSLDKDIEDNSFVSKQITGGEDNIYATTNLTKYKFLGQKGHLTK